LKLQSTILTFVLCLRLTSAVATFIGFEQAETFERHLSAMGSAAKYCTEAGLSGQLSKELENAGIFHQCELLVHSQPWKRHPAASTVKKIFAFLMVLFFRLLALH